MRIIKINDNNPEDFDNNILGCDCIIKFHMDGCSHCENMKEDWNKMLKVLKKKPINKDKLKILEVNGNALPYINSPVAKGVYGFPTIIKSTNGYHNANMDTYNGNRTMKDMLAWSLNKLNKNIRKTFKKQSKGKNVNKKTKKKGKKRRTRKYN